MIRRLFLADGARLSRRARIALIALFLVAVLAALPMRLALAWIAPPQISAREVSGTVWNGWIDDLRAGQLPLGSVKARIRPTRLLLGRVELHAERVGPAGTADFMANGAGGTGWARISEVNGTIPLGDGFGALPATALTFRDFRLEMAQGRCRNAEGQVSVVLASMSPLMPGPVTLSGTARCNRDALYVPMSGPSGMERLFVRVEADGRWRADLVLAGLPVEVTAPLLESGFTARPGGIGISATGTL